MSAPHASEEAAWLAQLRAEVLRRIKAQRTTQAALAGHVGITPKHLNQVLNGQASPSPGLAEQIATAMGLRITVVAEGEPVPLALDMRGRKPGSATAPDCQRMPLRFTPC